METDRRFRHELKFLLDKREMDICASRLAQFAHPDRHAPSGTYRVRSLYFDDMYSSAYEDKAGGVASRHKYRIRIYDMNDSVINLEKKVKEGAYIRKGSAALSRAEYDMIMHGETGFLLKRDEPVANEFAVEYRINALRPKVIVDYDRTPFVYEQGTVRITFDENIRSVFTDLDIFNATAPSYDVLGAGRLIMEVKYTEYLPDIFRAILPDRGLQTAASKFVMCVNAADVLGKADI